MGLLSVVGLVAVTMSCSFQPAAAPSGTKSAPQSATLPAPEPAVRSALYAVSGGRQPAEASPTPVLSPTPPPQVARPGTGTLPIRTATAEQLGPFFRSIAGSIPGIFIRKDGKLAYVDGGRTVALPMGANPVALVANDRQVLLSDAQRLYWLDRESGRLTAIANLPSVRKAVRHDDTYLLISASNEALVWTPDREAVTLERPEHLSSTAGASLSPDGRYAAVAYDLNIPNGPRVSCVWAYDLQTGKVFKHPDPIPAPVGGYGFWLLGWSDTQTLRFEAGARDSRGGQTWRVDQGAPISDGTVYRMMDDAVLSRDGAWFLYRPIPEQAVVQSVQPDSHPFGLPFPFGGVYDLRVLLNGHPAARDTNGWMEMLPDGTLRRWDGVEAVY